MDNLDSKKTNIKQKKVSQKLKTFLQSELLSHERLRLYMKQNEISDKGVSQLGTALGNCKAIQSLDINLMDNIIYLSKFSDLCDAFSKCQKLGKLFLDMKHNYLGDSGAFELGSALAELQNLSSLAIKFGYCYCHISYKRVHQKEFDYTQKDQQIKTSRFNFQNNQLGQNNISDLCLALEQCKNLSDLKLELKENKITNEGVLGLIQLLSNLKELSNLSVNLGFNSYKLNYNGEESILSQILQKCSEIKQLKLKLEYNQIQPSDMIGINQAFQKCDNIQNLVLDLRENKMSIEGILKFLNNSSKCNNLKKLTLMFGFLGINDKDIQVFCPILENFNQVQTLFLDFQWNSIDYQGALLLTSTLAKLTKLQNLTLLLDYNKIGWRTEYEIDLFSNIAEIKYLNFLRHSFNQANQRNLKRKAIRLVMCLHKY